jgi:hypothetical protein
VTSDRAVTAGIMFLIQSVTEKQSHLISVLTSLFTSTWSELLILLASFPSCASGLDIN